LPTQTECAGFALLVFGAELWLAWRDMVVFGRSTALGCRWRKGLYLAMIPGFLPSVDKTSIRRND
jgi:hypothetical protein